ncbi:MAG: flavin reductase [Clostridia bacterium]|nr:flavin reductase [Clostridia bacterium]
MANIENSALFKISYGLFVVTSNDGTRDNGLIVNTVSQITDSPIRVAVAVNKKNYSHDVIKETKKMNVCCLSVDAPFSIFETFGFKSGRDTYKFESITPHHSENGLAVLPEFINSFISLEVESYVDMDSHGMFICTVTEAKTISDKESMTYTYYQKNVKPKPETTKSKGYVCKICGYVYEGEPLPEDFICPWCKHGVSDFEKIK